MQPPAPRVGEVGELMRVLRQIAERHGVAGSRKFGAIDEEFEAFLADYLPSAPATLASEGGEPRRRRRFCKSSLHQ